MIPFPFQAAQFGRAAAESDQHWPSVASLLHMDGANGSATFPDQKGLSWTANGNIQISMAQSKFGGASAIFDGSGDYLSIAATSSFGFGTSDLTSEAWIYISGAQGTDRGLTDFRQANGSDKGTFFINTANKLAFWYGSLLGGSGAALSTNTWYHVALSRASGVFRCYLDGVLDWSASASVDFGSTAPCGIGGAVYSGGAGSSPFNGFIDEVRITKGVARYTANFTPPSAPFPNS